MNVDKSSSQRNETVIRCKAGEERAIQWYGRPRYGAGGQLDGWVIAGHDVTGTKHNLQRLRDYAAQVERLSREKTRFVSVASHELRTPLTIVRGFIDLLSETEPRANQRQILERIQAQLDRFTSLLDDLLDVSRIDAGESNLTLAVVDLEEITRQVLELLSPQAVAKGLSVKIADGPSPVIAYADSGSVMQIVTNVLLNAISYTRDGGSISVAVSSRSSKAEILISDTGIGIRDDEQELIFGEFHRTERARKMKANGNGLGLAIVRRLLSEMNGEIWVRSAGENMGTTVSITLPVSAEGAEKEMADADTDL